MQVDNPQGKNSIIFKNLRKDVDIGMELLRWVGKYADTMAWRNFDANGQAVNVIYWNR